MTFWKQSELTVFIVSVETISKSSGVFWWIVPTARTV